MNKKLPAGYFVDRSTVVPGLYQGFRASADLWAVPITGSYDTEEEAEAALLESIDASNRRFQERMKKR